MKTTVIDLSLRCCGDDRLVPAFVCACILSHFFSSLQFNLKNFRHFFPTNVWTLSVTFRNTD